MLETAVTAIVSNIRSGCAGLARVADALEAELFASGILAMLHAGALQDPEPLEILGVGSHATPCQPAGPGCLRRPARNRLDGTAAV